MFCRLLHESVAVISLVTALQVPIRSQDRYSWPVQFEFLNESNFMNTPIPGFGSSSVPSSRDVSSPAASARPFWASMALEYAKTPRDFLHYSGLMDPRKIVRFGLAIPYSRNGIYSSLTCVVNFSVYS